METKRQLGARVAALRRQRRLTQEQLAAKIGRSVDAISNIERGKSFPSLEMLDAMTRALTVDLSDLLVSNASTASPRRASLLATLRAVGDGLSDDDLQLAVEQLQLLQRLRPRR